MVCTNINSTLIGIWSKWLVQNTYLGKSKNGKLLNSVSRKQKVYWKCLWTRIAIFWFKTFPVVEKSDHALEAKQKKNRPPQFLSMFWKKNILKTVLILVIAWSEKIMKVYVWISTKINTQVNLFQLGSFSHIDLSLQNTTVEPRLSGPRLSGLFSLVPIFSWILISCDRRKQPNNPFKRLLQQRIILYAFQLRKYDKTENYSHAFSWYVIGSIVLLPREFHAWLIPSVWVV